MGRDTIQLEDAVSTISEEYLLEFTSEYGIPKNLHPELPGPEETIVDFSEGKVGVYTKFFEFANYRIPLSQFLFDILGCPKGWDATSRFLFYVGRNDVKHTPNPFPKTTRALIMPSRAESELLSGGRRMDLFNLISAPNPTKVKTGTRPRAAHEVPLLTATTNRVIDMEDITRASESSGTPSTVKKSPLDFVDEDPPPTITEKVRIEDQVRDEVSHEVPPVENPPNTKVAPGPDLEQEAAAMGSLVHKRRRKRGNDEPDANSPPKVLRKDHASVRPE
ncbi:hypothetical protein Tco_1485090 [Tanacetum coccineum]